MKKIFETNLTRNGLNVPVDDGYTRTVLRTVCQTTMEKKDCHFCLDILS